MRIKVRHLLALVVLSLLALISCHAIPAQAEEIKYRPEITDALQISFSPEDLHIVANPIENPFATKNLGISVATNNITGYYMTMSAESTDLLKSDDESGGIIPTLDPLDGGYTEDTFTVNHWGYKSAPSGNYFPLVSDTRIASGDTKTNGDTTNLTFATKVDFMKPSGTYETTLNFAAVANPLPIYLQDFTIDLCPENEPLEVIDIRDGEKYLVQKLADGACWMLDNLRLDPTEVTLGALKGYTNAPDEALEYLKNGGGTDQYAASAVVSDITGTGRDIPAVNAEYKNTTAYRAWGVASGKIGVYYNYCAASAGSYCYPYSDGADDDASFDICPKGWRMPTGGIGEDSELNTLYLAYDSDEAFKTAFSATISGNYRLGGPVLQDTYGRIWTSTRKSGSNMGDYYLTSSSTLIDYSSDRYWGESIRCIFGPGVLPTINYLQDMTNSIADKIPEDTVLVVKDKRDEEEYRIAKLADGNIWLLENLRIDPTEVSLEDLKGNTNATDETLEYFKNGGGTGQYPANGVSTSWSNDAYTNPIVYTNAKNTLVTSFTADGTQRKAGVHYNYCATSAGYYCYSSLPTGTSDQDICPAGWRLPIGGSNGDPQKLYEALNSDGNAYKTSLEISEAGYVSGGSISGLNSSDYLWTSTINNGSISTYGDSWQNGTDSPHYGQSVRCIYNKT